MANIGSLTLKEFQRLRTDRRTLFLIFVIPIILIVIFGLTSGGGPQKFFTVTIITEDEMFADNFAEENQTAYYNNLFVSIIRDNCTMFSFYNDIYFNITADNQFEVAKADAMKLLKANQIDAIIFVPANFSELVKAGESPVISFIADGSDINVLDGFETALMEPIGLFKLQTLTFQNLTVSMPYFEYDVPFYKAQVLNYALPMILPLLIVGLDMNLCSLCIVSEEALPRLVLTPSGKKDFILAKLLAYSAVMLVQVLEIFILVQFFGFYCRGELFWFFIGLALCGLVGISMGLAISAVARTSQQANQMFIILFIMTTLFSNAFLSVELMPPFMQRIARFFPMVHTIPLIRDITLRGQFSEVTPILGLIIVYLVVTYVAFALKKTEV